MRLFRSPSCGEIYGPIQNNTRLGERTHPAGLKGGLMGTIIGTTDDRTKRPARCRSASARAPRQSAPQRRARQDRHLRELRRWPEPGIRAGIHDRQHACDAREHRADIGRAPGATLPQSPTITIHKESAKDSARVATLTGPDIDGYNTRFRTYAAPAETTLLADTKYYVKIRGGDVSAYRTTRRDFAERAPGWGLPEGGESRVADPGVLGEHRVDIHRNQQTFTLDIALIDDDSM